MNRFARISCLTIHLCYIIFFPPIRFTREKLIDAFRCLELSEYDGRTKWIGPEFSEFTTSTKFRTRTRSDMARSTYFYCTSHTSSTRTTKLFTISHFYAGKHYRSISIEIHTRLFVFKAWSITYHSLLTLVFLLWACILWVLPNSRKWCLRTSPFFTLYGTALLILQYLSSFKISFDQLNFAYTRRTMEQIGISINDYQPGFIPLVVKVSRDDWIVLHSSVVCLVILYDILLVNITTIFQRTWQCECSTI